MISSYFRIWKERSLPTHPVATILNFTSFVVAYLCDLSMICNASSYLFLNSLLHENSGT